MADYYAVIFEFGPLPPADAHRIATTSTLTKDPDLTSGGPELTGGPEGWCLYGWGAWGLYGDAAEDTLIAVLATGTRVIVTCPPDDSDPGERRIYTPDDQGGHTLAKYETNAHDQIVITDAAIREIRDRHPDPTAFRQAVLAACGVSPGAP